MSDIQNLCTCKCGNADPVQFAVMKPEDNHTGLYCSVCGRWKKWLTRNDITLCKIHGCRIIK